VYKGASVPAISWGITDSILMGSLHNYRVVLKDAGFSEANPNGEGSRLTLLGHSVAGLFAGWTK
jgi:solute carrier family 25 carnitine/acylcarnitine transporter 20/29